MPPQQQPPTASPNALPQEAVTPPDPTDDPHIPMKGLDGTSPMTVGGLSKWPNLQFAPNVDFHHVNPQLLASMQKLAEKNGVHITVTTGYRSGHHEFTNGHGDGTSPHTKGLAVDAFVAGHPIGEVIPPEAWAKLGIRTGAAKGFGGGQSDPEHLELVGMPVKGGKK